MELKLELADIAGYLPYGLMVDYHCLNDDVEGVQEVIGCVKMHKSEKNGDAFLFAPLGGGGLFPIKYSKPILRPMTDLDKPMTHPDINNDEEFVPIDYWAKSSLCKEWVKAECEAIGMVDACADSHTIKYSVAYHQFLSKLHFDYNNLIGQGLAIDINTIKQ